jgi:hypothetical protein
MAATTMSTSLLSASNLLHMFVVVPWALDAEAQPFGKQDLETVRGAG